GRLACKIHLNEHVDRAAGLRSGLIQDADETGIVDRVHAVEERPSLFRFVRLQVADEMPGETEIARAVDLLLRFLDFVFAEVELTARGGGADVAAREGLGNGDEADRGRIAPGPAGGARDGCAHTVQPGRQRGGIEHYFFNCATKPFAVAAFGPSGESFKYVSNSVAASDSLP